MDPVVERKEADMSQNTRKYRAVVGAMCTIACTALFVGTPAAHAAGEPVAGCGNGWTLVTIEEAVQFIYDATPSVQPYRDDEWSATTLAALYDYDQSQNNDGYLCARSNGPTPGQDKQYCPSFGPGCVDYSITNLNDNRAVGQHKP